MALICFFLSLRNRPNFFLCFCLLVCLFVGLFVCSFVITNENSEIFLFCVSSPMVKEFPYIFSLERIPLFLIRPLFFYPHFFIQTFFLSPLFFYPHFFLPPLFYPSFFFTPSFVPPLFFTPLFLPSLLRH